MHKSKAGLDWAAIRQEYVSSDVALKALADKYKINQSSIRRRAALDKWQDARTKFQAAIAKKTDAAQIETRVQKLRAWNDQDLKIAAALRAQTARSLNRIAREQQGNDTIETSLLDIGRMAQIVESAQRIARLALGATTDNQGNINDPDENGTTKPRLSDFYDSIQFEGPNASTAPVEKDDGSNPPVPPAAVH